MVGLVRYGMAGEVWLDVDWQGTVRRGAVGCGDVLFGKVRIIFMKGG